MYVGAYNPQHLSAFSPRLTGVSTAGRDDDSRSAQIRAGNSTGKDTSRVLATELVRRLDLNSIRVEDETESKLSDPGKHLQLSLTKAFSKIEKDYGHDAAVAVMGIFAAAVDDGSVGEEALGGAMLDAVHFMDRNFGFAGGDKLISLFNGDLNKRVNEYFDNGLNEQIYTKTQVENAIDRAVSQVTGTVLEKFGQEDAEAVASILKAALENGEDGLGAAMREGTREAVAYLEEKYGVEAMAGLETGMAEAVQGPDSAYATPPGAILDVAV